MLQQKGVAPMKRMHFKQVKKMEEIILKYVKDPTNQLFFSVENSGLDWQMIPSQ